MNLKRDREAYEQIANKVSKTDAWYRITNKSEPVADVYIYDEISVFGITAQDFIDDLKGITSQTINVYINSVGGSFFDGVAIFNALRSHPATVNTQIDSLGASIASVIFQAGDTRTMLRHSQMMIHDAQGIVMGGPEDMAEMASLLDSLSDEIAEIYAERAGDKRRTSTFRNLMKAETFLGDQEAVDQGLADRVLTPQRSTNNSSSGGAVEASATLSTDDPATSRDDKLKQYASAFADSMEIT